LEVRVILWREGRVAAVRRTYGAVGGEGGAVECDVDVTRGGRCVALAYPSLVGTPQPGDRVLLNTAALERGLGTGGYAFVVALVDNFPIDQPMGPGHLVKARYTPFQAMVQGVDEQGSPHHDVLAEADDLLGMPVVVADLHSAVPAIVAGIRDVRPDSKVAYVMTDGGALPAWFSQTVARLRDTGWVATCITAGQAFGGDLEAVTLHSALLAARHVVDADIVVVAQGPGNLGTGTRWGFSGLAAGEAVNAAAVLHGHPVAALRISGADQRPRHRGVSHHSLTAYGHVALTPADVVVPTFDGPTAALGGGLAELGELVRSQVEELVDPVGPHRAVHVSVDGLMQALSMSPVPLSTMGRSLAEDPAAFLASAAAGRHAAGLLPPAP
jgi:hypothetical protein